MNWQAKWIWARGSLHSSKIYMYARKEMEITSCASANIYITCSSEYKLYINGRYIGRGPGPCNPAYQYYDQYDISHVLRPGKNVAAVVCYSLGIDSPGGLLLQLEINDECREFTGESWKVKPADDWNFKTDKTSQGFEEDYDSQKKPVGWNVVGFDDYDWEEPEVISDAESGPWHNIIPRPIPNLRERDVFPKAVIDYGYIIPGSNELKSELSAIKFANAITKSTSEFATVTPQNEININKDAYCIIDFGRQVVGYPNIRIRDGGCAEISIAYSKSPDICPIIQTDRLTLHGGRQQWQAFSRRSFRYLMLTFKSLRDVVHIESVSINHIGYPIEHISWFECSDEQLNSAWTNEMHNLSLCMQNLYECEQSHNLKEVRVEALQNYYCFNDPKLVAKELREAAWRQDDDIEWVILLYDYCLYTGDMGILSELYQNMKRLLNAHQNDIEEYEAIYRKGSEIASFVGEDADAFRWSDGVWDAHCDNEKFAYPTSPAYYLPAEQLGVKPVGLNTDDVIIHPMPGDLSWARGRIQIRGYFVNVYWHMDADQFEIDIDSETGFVVALPVNIFDNPIIEEHDLNPDTPEKKARKTYGWGSVIWKDGKERDPYIDWLSSQDADVPENYKRKTRCKLKDGYVWISDPISNNVRFVIRSIADGHDNCNH